MQGTLTALALFFAQTAPAAQPAASGGGSEQVLWAVILFGVAVVLFFVELMVPTGGLLFFAAAVAVCFAIFFLFKVSTLAGGIGIIVTLLSLPFLFAAAINILPNTPIMRMMTLKNAGGEREGDATLLGEAEATLVGQTGEVVTTLRPGGTVTVGGRRLDAVSLSGEVRRGEAVVVVSQDGLGLKVRKA